MGLGSSIGGLLGSVIPGVGTAVGGAAGGIFDYFLGGSGGGSSSSGSSGGGSSPLDYYAQYGALAAAANSPLTLAGQRYSTAVGSQAGALGLLGSSLSSAELSVLKDALEMGKEARTAQANEATNLVNKGLNLAEQTAQARLGVGLLAPQYMAQAASAALQGDNTLAMNLANTNLGLKALQESAKTNITQQYAKDLGSMAQTRATGEANLALGAQRIAGDLAKYDASIVGNLTLNKAKTESDLSRIRANAAATKDLRRNAMDIAFAGKRAFA